LLSSVATPLQAVVVEPAQAVEGRQLVKDVGQAQEGLAAVWLMLVGEAEGFLGPLGRNTFVGPNLRSVDFSLAKKFPLRALGEGGNVQFRAEVFNLLNRANFGPPAILAFAGAQDGEAPLGSFGRITSTVTSSRQIQFGLRIGF